MANKVKSKYNPLTIFISSHVPFRVPSYINEHPDTYKIITNCDDPFPPTKLDLLRVNKMKCDYGPEQNKCLNEWRMINAIYNMKHLPEYIGICHYRRYFDPNVIDRLNMRVLEENGYEMVIGQPVRYMDALHEEHDSFSYYGYWHNYKDFLKLEEVVKRLYPTMADAFDEMKEQDYLYNSAMTILKRDDFIDLCEFNFSIYDELMKEYGFKNDEDAFNYVGEHLDEYVKPYNRYYDQNMQSRLISYLTERSWNVWMREKRDDGTSLLDHAAEIQWFMPNEKDIKV